MYYGPPREVTQFFTFAGYPMTAHYNPADFMCKFMFHYNPADFMCKFMFHYNPADFMCKFMFHYNPADFMCKFFLTGVERKVNHILCLILKTVERPFANSSHSQFGP